MNINTHILLMGFKSIGKSVLAKHLAQQIKRSFIDIDDVIEDIYQNKKQSQKTCRQIMKDEGENFFRQLETKALQRSIQKAPAIIALGGGTPLLKKNRHLMQSQYIIYVTAKPEEVFARMLQAGKPAFFSETNNAWDEFQRVWKMRQEIYQPLADMIVYHQNSIENTVNQMLIQLEQKFK